MRQVLCISGQRWLTVPNRTQQLMSRLENAQILFFEPPANASEDWRRPGRKVRQNVIVHTLPPELTQNAALRLLSRVSAGRTVRFIRERMDRVHFSEPLLWCSSPAGAEFMEELPHRGLVYDCYQDWPEYPESWESELAVNADVCFAASPDLLRHLAPCNGNVTLLPNGCNYPMFAKDKLPRPGPLRRTQAPILGYVGTLWRDLDLAPLIQAADALSNCAFVLIGQDMGNPLLPELLSLPNVRWLGPMAPVELPDYICSFRVCLYLLRRSGYYDDVIHPRMFEYLSSGKPIVAMLQPDQVEHFPDVVYGAHDNTEFVKLCVRALEEAGPWARDRRRSYGKAAAWSARAGVVNQILDSIGLI